MNYYTPAPFHRVHIFVDAAQNHLPPKRQRSQLGSFAA